MKKVAIIGAGPAGLVAAKECLDGGLDVTIYEKSSDIGGVWSHGKAGMVWDDLRTNISKYSCCYSDFDWQKTDSEFPKASDLTEYLIRYADHHNLLQNIKFNTTIAHLGHKEGNQSIISVSIDGQDNDVDFDFAIVCSGFFSKESYPFKNLEKVKSDFEGVVLHAKNYKQSKDFEGMDVTVIGGSFGGVDIAASIASSAKSVTHLFREAPFVISRYPMKENMPFDILSGSRDSEDNARGLSLTERYKMANNWLLNLTDQNSVNGNLIKGYDSSSPPKVAISDKYLDLVANGKIKPVKISGLDGYDYHEVKLKNQPSITSDALVFCTGYNHGLDFLSSNLKETLKYREDDNFLPISAYQSTFHPDIPNVGFVGAYRGPYFSVMELQARTLSKLFAGEINLAGIEGKIQNNLASMEQLRSSPEKPQFPYRHISMGDSLAELCGIMPSVNDVPSDIYASFKKSAVVPAHYRLYGDGACYEKAVKTIRSLPKLEASND